MDTYTATALAYNNGYDQGYKQGKKDAAREQEDYEGLKNSYDQLQASFDQIYDANMKMGVDIRSLRERTMWISVKERLPEDGVRVLTACDDGLVRLGISKGGFPSVINRKHKFSDVTHWMPLPELPMDGGNEDG